VNADPSLCPTHGTSYNPNVCYDCVNAELAWISQTALGLVERGYTQGGADHVASEWAWCRRMGFALPEHVRAAQADLQKPFYRH
jgi:hypothetical protein